MSGIAGLIKSFGTPVSPIEIDHISMMLRHRGPDGLGLWQAEGVCLFHFMLHTTEESLSEHLPLAVGQWVLTSDARIDNREELFSALKLDGSERAEITDSALILLSYQRWGLDCPKYLVGDFAFAIWDRPERRLFCARDAMGCRPLFYRKSKDCFEFASEIKALDLLPGHSRRLNKHAMAAFLQMERTNRSETFFEGIYKLPPGHSMTWENGLFRLQRYWNPEEIPMLRLAGEAEYLQAFREVFCRAVSDRVRSAFPVGATLSGGLDSSSIVAVAAQRLKQIDKKLVTVSGVLEPQRKASFTDERFYMEKITGRYQTDAHFVFPEGNGLQHDSEHWFRIFGFPTTSPNELTRVIHKTLKQKNVRILLSGDGGDQIASASNNSQLAYWLLRGNWLRFYKEFSAYVARSGTRPSQAMKMTLRNYILPRFVFYASQKNNFPSVIQPQFAAQFEDIPPIWRTDKRFSIHSRANELFYVHKGMNIYPELENMRAAKSGIESTYPMLDKRLIELCLATPGEWKFRNGISRYLIRMALSEYLPPEILWRRDKGRRLPDFIERFEEERENLLHFVGKISETDPARAIIKVELLEDLLLKSMNQPPSNKKKERLPISFFMGIEALRFLHWFQKGSW